MMVEMMLESSQDFGMSTGLLPQWKRELLQRRASRPRPPPAAPPAAPPPPPPPPAEDDEELRYGPGIVKRLKTRYLSLALREQPRRRPSVLRRAASLEQLDEPPPRPRPASLAAPPKTLDTRRESVKRARSVDALARLEAREELPLPPTPPTPPITNGPSVTNARTGRPPRRPQPLLRDTERPPADVVRTTMRKFEPRRMAGPAARVAAVLRGLEARSSTPEPRAREPSPPAADLSAIELPVSPATRHVSRAALDGIAKAGSTVRYSFGNARAGDHLPPLQTANPVLLARHHAPRRVGVIRPMPPHEPEEPAKSVSPVPKEEVPRKATTASVEGARSATPPESAAERSPTALVEPIPRSPAADLPVLRLWERRIAESPERAREQTPELEKPIKKVEVIKPEISRKPERFMNGHREVTPEINGDFTDNMKSPEKIEETVTSLVNGKSRITSPKIDRVTSPTIVSNSIIERVSSPKIEQVSSPKNDRVANVKTERVDPVPPKVERITSPKSERVSGPKVVGVSVARADASPGAGGKPRRARPAAAAAPCNSVVFNFADRKEVPDYIENDGIILRNKRDKIKAGDPGVVVLRPEALGRDSSDEEEEADRAPSPCGVRFVNDNVLINGKSSMPTRPNKDRISKLKLQFDDSLTRTFEYPSETSLCEEDLATACADPASPAAPATTPAAPCPAPATTAAAFAPLTDNTHMSLAAALGSYWPRAARADSFELGVAPPPAAPATPPAPATAPADHDTPDAAADNDALLDQQPAAAAEEWSPASWSRARSLHADLLF